ncbi:MFS transporter [Fodinisporobacter ferrooxydans]|uniref:MFS transporter n=1 Tax=Fodinisporobacter ferrooxydans TaxID=2901836 RepID=A0ABY4CNI8_9BACL|nr:MFS transporter [Alicyclobacillaceae bacterium MYW30-H2]
MSTLPLPTPNCDKPHQSSLWSHFPLKSICNRRGYHWYVVGTVCIGAFMAALDASIINIALPTFQAQFHMSINSVEWISLVYLLTLAALIVTFGRLADLFGRRWMYSIGFLIFIIGSTFCGTASSVPLLLISRVVQAIGAAMLQANSVAIITAATPSKDRGKAIGLQASAQGIGLSLGPAIGGALIHFLSWRWLFFVNIPVGIIGTTLGVLFLPKDSKNPNKEGFDYLGTIILAPTLVALIYLLNMGLKQGWTSPVVMMSYTITIVGMVAFIWIERNMKFPMVDLSLFKNPTFTLGNVTGILSFAVMYAVLLLVPFYLAGVQKINPLQSGLFLSIIPIGMTIFTPISGAIADRFGTRIPTIIGMSAAACGSIMLSFVGGNWTYLYLILGLFLVGSGLGIFTPPNNSSVMGSTPSHRLGVAGGILNMSRTLGMGFGITFGGLSYQLFISYEGVLSEHMASSLQMLFAFRMSFVVIAAVAGIACILSAVRQNKKKKMIIPSID